MGGSAFDEAGEKQGQPTGAASEAATAPSAAPAEALRARGETSPAAYAEAVRARPGDRAAVFRFLQGTFGNAFVQQVIGLLDARPASAPGRSAGAPLPDPVRAKFEGALGADLGGVRVHEGEEAPLMGARAFAHGNDLHFAPGEYAPGSAAGDAVIGHELVHSIQQARGGVASAQAKREIAEDGALEQQADDLGERAAHGEAIDPTRISAAATPGIARVVGQGLAPRTKVWIRSLRQYGFIVKHYPDRKGYQVSCASRLATICGYEDLDLVPTGAAAAAAAPAPAAASAMAVDAAHDEADDHEDLRDEPMAVAKPAPPSMTGAQAPVGLQMFGMPAAAPARTDAPMAAAPMQGVQAAPQPMRAASFDNDHGVAFQATQNTAPADFEEPAPAAAAAAAPAPRRVTRNAWSEGERGQIEQLGQQIAGLRQIFVPRDPDGAWLAYRAAPAGDTHRPAVLQGGLQAPDNKAAAFPTAYRYADEDYQYTIELVRPERLGTIPGIVGDGSVFEITSITPPISKTATGRAYTGTQAFFANPRYRGAAVAAPTTRAAAAARAAIQRFDNEQAARAAHFVPQPTSDQEPYVFCVPEDFDDPKQTANPAQDRRFRSEAQFEGDLAAGAAKSARSMATRTPAQRRAEAGRIPQAEAGNVPAAAFMGDAGTRATQGHLASHEYCHLIGDGDGGLCDRRNLVVGTNSVNTEQLAMEETLRPFRPKFRQLGCSVMLDVTSTTGATPAAPAGGEAWVRQSKAEFIRYRIQIIPVDVALRDMHRLDVHTQIMDGQRGTITEMEVELLKATIERKMAAALETVRGHLVDDAIVLQQQPRAMPAARYEDGAMSPPRTPDAGQTMSDM